MNSIQQDSGFELSGQPSPTFLDIAEFYLKKEARPLAAKEIVAAAIRDGMLLSVGKTPWQTMKSKLSTDILTNGELSRFKRVYPGVFALRTDKTFEYKANRFIKGKLDEMIAVIDRRDLGKLIPGTGFSEARIDRAKLSKLAFSKLRRDAEEDFNVVQLVSVFIVNYAGQYLTHMRSARLPESRLRGEYSLMLGGHLAMEDFEQLTLDLFDSDLSDCSYILRELSEELILDSNPIVHPKGYIYDESREVSKQHLGLVYNVTIPRPDFQIGERGFLMNAKMETLDSILSRRAEFENWSWILMNNIDKL